MRTRAANLARVAQLMSRHGEATPKHDKPRFLTVGEVREFVAAVEMARIMRTRPCRTPRVRPRFLRGIPA